MSMINAEWHKRNRMPRATSRQRLRWHVAHANACGCRALTPAMLLKLHRAAQQETRRSGQHHVDRNGT
jgi:hypothetical protein